MKAWMVFLDESGILMAPLLRRSWHPRGNTPTLSQRTRSHKKVSIIGALCVPPSRDRVHLFFRLHPNVNINQDHVTDFLWNLVVQLDAPIMLLWDRLQAHRSAWTKEFVSQIPDLQTEHFPPYAPELNPIELFWGYLKTNPLANFTPYDLESLITTSRHHARSLQRKEYLLRSFLKHSPLSLRLK